jgi:hypothetical protein
MVALCGWVLDYEFVILACGWRDFGFPNFVPWSAMCRPPTNNRRGNTMKTYFAVAALSFAFAGIAHADGAEYQVPQAGTSTVTRAAVLAELADAQAKGLLQTGERDWPQIAFTSQRTRAEVRAETLQAIASGELRFLNEEPQSAFGTFVPKRKAGNTPITVAAK